MRDRPALVVRLSPLLFAVVAVACRRTPPPAPAPAADASLSAKAAESPRHEHARRLRQRARVPAVAVASVTREGAEIFAVGEAHVARHVEADADTPFEAASIAKTIIGTCVMQLVSEGRMKLDADVSAYVGFRVAHPKHRVPITPRLLLAHTSSVADDLPKLRTGPDVALDAFLRGYLAAPSAYHPGPPGERMQYSNAGAALAALAVERIAGKRFDEVARERVFAPLRMTSTGFRPSELPRAAAAGHRATDGGFRETPPAAHAVYPVVDLFSTARDLARFARAILRGGELDGVRILPADAVAEMLRPSPPSEALGWQIRTFGGARVVGHEGEDAGASTGLYLDTERGVGAVVLANGDAFASGDASRAGALGELVELLLGAPPGGEPGRGVSSPHAD